MIAYPPQVITPIGAEELRSVNFKNSQGYLADGELKDRCSKLHLSILLCDHARAIVKIVFNTIDGYKEVKASIWGATEKYIILTSGSFIPVEAVALVSLD